jgi:hypothetical protein
MRLRRAVPQIPPKSSVPHELPLYKNRLFLTHSESTLPQMLIPLHFNFRICNVYKKLGEGIPLRLPKVLQLVTPSRFVIPSEARNLLFPFSSGSLHPYLITLLHQSKRWVDLPQPTHFPAALRSHLQLAENKTTLSPASATLTDTVTPKSSVCRSCEKYPG